MSYSVEMTPEAKNSLMELDKPIRERIKRKIDEIADRLEKWNMDPDGAVEKRLKGPLNHILQQRVGDYRIWFEDIKDDQVLLISFVGHKEEAEDQLG